MIRLFALPLIALTCAGCPALDRLEGKKSEAQLYHERMQTAETETAVATLLDVTPAEVEAVASIAAPVEAVTLATIAEPTCHEEFREHRCDGNQMVPWFYGDAPEAPEPVVVAEVVPEPVVVPAPVVEAPRPVCQAVFRVKACSDDGEEIWL